VVTIGDVTMVSDVINIAAKQEERLGEEPETDFMNICIV
jgi:hypothetical protein